MRKKTRCGHSKYTPSPHPATREGFPDPDTGLKFIKHAGVEAGSNSHQKATKKQNNRGKLTECDNQNVN
jgi:hypothetical protein